MTAAVLHRMASSWPEALGVVHRHDAETTTNTRRVDYEFVQARRLAGVPDAAIARMGRWCLADVLALPRVGLAAVRRAPEPEDFNLDPMTIPEVAEILRHIADQYCIRESEILGHSHAPEIVEPRHEAFAVVWELNRFTMREIAGLFDKTVPGITYGLQRHYERINTRGYGRDW